LTSLNKLYLIVTDAPAGANEVRFMSLIFPNGKLVTYKQQAQ